MIDRREIIDAATRFRLNPHVIEKDLVLGWVLAGIAAHGDLADTWIFKGGTCLKKCYFETYRFSEDLDFTLTDPAHIDQDFLKRAFGEIGEWVYEQTGIELPGDKQDFDIYENPRGTRSCQGKLSYCGPVSPRSGGWPRLKLDLTADEKVVLPPVRVPIFHPYSDAPEDGIYVLAYAYEEAFGEKIRALAERARPRDLYDVVNLFRNDQARPPRRCCSMCFGKNARSKGSTFPGLPTLKATGPISKADGRSCSRISCRPCRLSIISGMNCRAFSFGWKAVPLPWCRRPTWESDGETVLRDRGLRLAISSGAQSFLEVIRFAASNRLCVELDYQGSTRRIEPYSLRRTGEGNIVLHAFNTDKSEHRSYRVDRIAGARTTNQTFVPRYEIELTPEGPVHIKAASRSVAASFGGAASRPVRTSRRSTSSSGPTYVYECPYCSKRFNRNQHNAVLNPHKNKQGYPCSGRHGCMSVPSRKTDI